MSIDWELTLSVARAVALVGALLVFGLGFRHWKRNAERDAQRLFEQLDLVRAELMMLSERVEQLNMTPRTIERPVPQEAPRVMQQNNAAPARGYEVAARLARGGATCEELISSCGLSRHEAELLLRLHRAEATRNQEAQTSKQATTAKSSDTKTPERRSRLSLVG
ncbi:MAG: DUF2802 domain-containing protein [Steroidobacteraceae bacterium]